MAPKIYRDLSTLGSPLWMLSPLWILSYKQQSLAYSNMCYLFWSHVERDKIVFFIYVLTTGL